MDLSSALAHKHDLQPKNSHHVKVSNSNTVNPHIERWQWTINSNDGSITNAANPTLAISSSKEKDVSLNSNYFALQNPRTQLAIGVEVPASGCANNMPIKLQEMVYGSPNQQFMYLQEQQKIVGLLCPDYVIEVPNGDCAATAGLHLSNVAQTDGRNQWTFVDNDSVIKSVKCPGMFITINGASSEGVETVKFVSGLPDAPRSDNSKTHADTSYTPAQPSTESSWTDNTPPTIGSSIVLASQNSQRYQKWVKEHQFFQPLMGPFSIVNPTNGLAIAVEDGVCSSGMELRAITDDHTNTRQLFYLGQHGAVFSSVCPGLVISADSNNPTDATFDHNLKLQTSRLGQDNLKWKFSNGMVESVRHPGMVIGNTNGILTLGDKAGVTDPSQTWQRINTRLLDVNSDQTMWKQEWTVSFVTPGYDTTSIEKLTQLSEGDSTTCYQPDPAFSASFDDFATGLVIKDASDEDQCRHTREQLGFGKDHP